MLRFRQWLEGWKIKLHDYVTRSGYAIRLEAFTFESFDEIHILLLLISFELAFINRDVVVFIDFRMITKFHHVEAIGPTGRAKRCVDAKINTLEFEGKCSPSSGKSTKRASQFDLQLTRNKQKLNMRAYRLEF